MIVSCLLLRALLAGQQNVENDLSKLENEAVAATEVLGISHEEQKSLEEELQSKARSLCEMQQRLTTQKALIQTLEEERLEMQAKITQLALAKIKLEEEKQQLQKEVKHLRSQLTPVEKLLET